MLSIYFNLKIIFTVLLIYFIYIMNIMDDNTICDISKDFSSLHTSKKNYTSYNQSDTDTAGSDGCFRPKSSTSSSHRVRQKRKQNCGYHSDSSVPKTALLPPIGVFWDIENCQVPRGRSAMCIAQMIRDLYFDGYREAEFIVVCDVRKETNQVIQELCDAQVNLIHVSSTSKNAADEKLRQCMRRFADTYGAPSAIILITTDVNFAGDLSDLRHRKKIHVILLHKPNVSKALVLCASEHHCFTELTNSIPIRPTCHKNYSSPVSSPVELAITNLPVSQGSGRVRNRLRQLSDNCGGRVLKLDSENGVAVIRFATDNHALRAQKRMDGEDVFGHKILAQTPPQKLDVLDMDEGYQTTTSSTVGCSLVSPLPPIPHLFLDKGFKSEPKHVPVLERSYSTGRSKTESTKSSFKIIAPDPVAKNLFGSNKNQGPVRARSTSPFQLHNRSQSSSNSSDIEVLENDSPFCPKHCGTSPNQRWALYNVGIMPSVKIGLKKLNENLCKLVDAHNGSVPLASLAMCYAGDLGGPLIIDNKLGAPLEHLMLSCSGVLIKKYASGVKYIVRAPVDVPVVRETGQELGALQDLSNDFIILLRSYDRCLLSFDKLAQAYHNRFGIPCKITEYGFKKFVQLVEALSPVVQILGEGQHRVVTLTHKIQKRLFASDLCKVLRTCDRMQMFLSELPLYFTKVLGRPFNITDYGVCFISDILDDLNDHLVIKKKQQNGDVLLSRPQKRRHDIEIQRTVSFKLEVIELLTNEAERIMYINKFSSAYQQYFGKQCLVHYYGFEKLVELFEAISDIVEIIESDTGCNDLRRIRLKLVHSNMLLIDVNKVPIASTEILLQSPPPSQLPKPSMDLLVASGSKDQDDTMIYQCSGQFKRKSRLAAIFPSGFDSDYV